MSANKLEDRAMTSLTVLKNTGAESISVQDMILQQKLMNCLTKATEEQTKLIKASN
jgi:hypothetical protein